MSRDPETVAVNIGPALRQIAEAMRDAGIDFSAHNALAMMTLGAAVLHEQYGIDKDEIVTMVARSIETADNGGIHPSLQTQAGGVA